MATQTDRGVSPVVGVVLLLAITILLVATIAMFTLDLASSSTGDTDDPLGLEPDAEFSALHSGSTLILTHDGGEAIDADSLEIRGDPIDGPVQWDSSGTVSEGDSRSVATDGEGVVEVVYRGPTDDVVLFETEL